MADRQQLWHRALPALLAFAFIGVFTLRPSPRSVEMVELVPWNCLFPCRDQSLRDAILNTFLFIPFGLTLRQRLPAATAFLIVLATTVAIETSQGLWLVGRDPSLRDVLTNAAGGGIGIWLAVNWHRLLHGPAAWNAPLALLTGTAWALLLATTALLVQPSLPRSRFWGQWAPELGQFDIWRGQLLSVTVNQYPLPKGRMHGGDVLRRELLSDSVMVQATVIAGPPPEFIAPIASVFDSAQRGIFVLGQRRDDLVFMIRTGLRAAALGEQWVALRAFPGRKPGDTTVVSGGVVGKAWVMRAVHDGRIAETRIPMTPGLMWSALFPFTVVLGPAAPLLSAAWLGATILPAGFFAGRGSPPRGRLAMASALAVACLTWVALAAGLGIPPVLEYLGTLLGLAAGWFGGRAVG